MQPIECHFADTIEQLGVFTLAATAIVKDIYVIAPADLQNRCEELSGMQKKFSKDNEQFFSIMEFIGPGILDNSYIGEFQRALDKSILACNILYAVVLEYKQHITETACLR